jgi:ribosomal protein S18 acetylase RimI-like enzyme
MEVSSIEVRPVRPEEQVEAGRVTALAYREFVPPGDDDPDWEGYLRLIQDVPGRVDRTTVLVAVQDGRILGSVTLEEDGVVGDDDPEPEEDASHVRMLGVDPAARGMGVGRALMEASIERARARGKRFVTLRTTELMEAASGLYASMGFHPDPARDLEVDEDFVLTAYRLEL